MLPYHIILQTSATVIQSFPINPLPWFPVAFIAAVVVLMLCGIIYAVAPLLGSLGLRRWSVLQMYETMLSVALIMAFLAFAYLMSLNPLTMLGPINAQTPHGPMNLVPSGCTDSGTVNTIYTLSTCDLAQFNNASFSMFNYIYYFTILKAFVPSLNITFMPVPTSPWISFGVNLPKFLPDVSSTFSVFNYVEGTFLVTLILNQLQLMILSGALLFMSLFFLLGLAGRVFGISRGFAGAMLALGIGIGLLYPMMTAITYGFIDVSANTYCVQSITCSLLGANAAANTGIISALLNTFLGGFLSSAGSSFSQVIMELGYLLSGLIIIPIFNIIVVDVFVVDLSRAAGERISFTQLFSSLI